MDGWATILKEGHRDFGSSGRHLIELRACTNVLVLRATLAFLALPAVIAGLVPWLICKTQAPTFFQWPGGIVFFLIGGGILLASVISFYRRGRGTLAPWDPPKHLVVQDLYRFNRNPMYVGVVMVLLGWSVVTGNPWNYAYAAVIPVIFHLRVVLYEERQMERLFGQEWHAYRSAVPRWGLTLRGYSPSVQPSTASNDVKSTPKAPPGRD